MENPVLSPCIITRILEEKPYLYDKVKVQMEVLRKDFVVFLQRNFGEKEWASVKQAGWFYG